MFEKLAKYAARTLELDMEDQKIATFGELASFIESKLN